LLSAPCSLLHVYPVKLKTISLGLSAPCAMLPAPYNPDHKHLLDLGYQPTHDIEAEMEIMLKDLMRYKHRIEARAHALVPDIRWDGTRRKVQFLERQRILKVAKPS